MTNLLEIPGGYEMLQKTREETAKAMDAPEGWTYRDLPNMLPEFWTRLIDWIGVDEYKLLTFAERTWPDGMTTVRGQMLISPIGLANLARNSEDFTKDDEVV